uniref:histidine kinase n=1 Tax=Solibacter usitatus (strain Ellin6076) TaxID=234267 RepID=Q023R0_SOLUE
MARRPHDKSRYRERDRREKANEKNHLAGVRTNFRGGRMSREGRGAGNESSGSGAAARETRERPTVPGFQAPAEMAGALLESASQAIVSADQAGTIVLVNRQAEEMFGYHREELLGSPIEILLPEVKRAAHVQMRAEYLRRQTIRPMGSGLDLSARRKDGSQFPVEVGLSHIKTANGVFAIAFISDISQRKRLEQQLQLAQKMEAVGRLAGGIAHDFNNMLTVIAGYGSMIMEKLQAQDPLRDHVEEIVAATTRAAALTSQLLAFSRQGRTRPQPINLNELIANIEKMLRRLIREDIALELILQDGLLSVKADPDRVEQAIVNLVVNARDAMPGAGRITVETANVYLDESYARSHVGVQPGEFAMIAVSDTGTGMDPEVMRRIFEPFFTTKAQGKGVGLGLATVYGMVKQAGGGIWVYSEPGKGTTFKAYFPIAGDTVATSSAATVQTAVPGDETILVVEDDASVRSVTVKMLEQLGYVALAAGNGAEALAKSKAHSGTIALVVTDVVMPNMGGCQLAAELAGTRPDIKVLYLSGYTESVAIQRGMIDGTVPFLAKPFNRQVLAKTIRCVLDGR